MNLEKGLLVDVVYYQFKSIDNTNYGEIITFFEENKDLIVGLEETEYTEIFYYYCKALFETASYYRFLLSVDHLIEITIEYNIFEVNGENVYFEALFDKAAAHYNLGNDKEASKILDELLRIDPGNEYVQFFFKKIERRKNLNVRMFLRSMSIVFFLLSAALIFCEILIVKAFFPDLLFAIEWTRTLLFVSALVVLIVGEAYAYARAHLVINSKIKAIRRRKPHS